MTSHPMKFSQTFSGRSHASTAAVAGDTWAGRQSRSLRSECNRGMRWVWGSPRSCSCVLPRCSMVDTIITIDRTTRLALAPSFFAET